MYQTNSSLTFSNHISNLTHSSYFHLRRLSLLGLSESLSPSLFLPLSSTHLSVLVLITLYSLASLKFDYLIYPDCPQCLHSTHCSSSPFLSHLLFYDTTTSLASLHRLHSIQRPFPHS